MWWERGRGEGIQGNWKGREIKETPRRRISVTSSYHEIFHSSAGKKGVSEGERRYSACLRPFLQQATGQMFEDDVNDGFSSISDTCIMGKGA
jgi:hypothetical protein